MWNIKARKIQASSNLSCKRIGPRACPWVSIIYFLILLVFKFILKKHKPNHVQDKSSNSLNYIIKAVIHDKKLLLLLFISMLMFIGYSQIQSTLPQVLQINNIPNYLVLYSKLLIISAFVVIICQVPFGLIFEKMPISVFTYTSTLLMIASFLLLAIAKSPFLFISAIVLLSMAEIITALATNVLVDKISPSNMRGMYFGAVNIGTIGMFLGPIIGGALLQFKGSGFLYVGIALIVSIVLILYYKFDRLTKQ